MRSELEYKMYVEQPVRNVMPRVAADAESVGIQSDEFLRAVFEWAGDYLAAMPTQPWMLEKAEKLARERDQMLAEEQALESEDAGEG